MIIAVIAFCAGVLVGVFGVIVVALAMSGKENEDERE
jgi:hypothetical protein